MTDSDEEVLRRLLDSNPEALRKLFDSPGRRDALEGGTHLLVCRVSPDVGTEISGILERAGVTVSRTVVRKVRGVSALYLELDGRPPEHALIAARDLAGEAGITYIRMPRR